MDRNAALFFFFALLLRLLTFVAGLGTQCSAPLGAGTAGPDDPYWLQSIQHQGTSPFGPAGYQVFRNVKDFGAKGDGVSDDTVAINAAISSGGRCGQGTCASSTVTPAIIFFPQGTYLVSAPIIAYYYTELVGDARIPPTLLATSDFNGIAVVDGDPYGANGNWYDNTNNFYRSVRNFVIDLTQMPPSVSATGFHWQVSQATSLYNIVVNMSTEEGNVHRGIFMENGSGGFMGDLVFNGGQYGIWIGNQQFTVRNITINNANTAIFASWNWGWTFQGVTIKNCTIGLDLTIGSPTGNPQGVEAEAIIDAVVTDTPVFVRLSTTSSDELSGSLVLNNIKLNNVTAAVGVVGGDTILAGGTKTIDSWVQGNVYSGTNPTGQFVQGFIDDIPKPSSLLDSSGRIFGKGRPAYADYAVSQIVSVKSEGAAGDGSIDDTAALQTVFDKFSGCKIIYFDAGMYVVSSTLTVPVGTRIVGEAWTTIIGSGTAFTNQNDPQVVVKVGEAGSTGVVEISGMLFTTRSPANGAIVIEWNVHDPSKHQGAAGMWDTLMRLGGAAGTGMQITQCDANLTDTGDSCFAAFLGLHITSGASAYLEGTWLWLADHDVDAVGDEILITAFSGRGLLSESQGPVWLIGTSSEHHVIYQYNLAGASDHYLGLIQTETPYFQPSPAPPAPFISSATYHDPIFDPEKLAAWALYVQNSNNILVYGAGLYSFFQNYVSDCQDTSECQAQIVNIKSSSINIYSLSTVASIYQISIDENGIINKDSNANGFAPTVTVWTSS